MYSRHSLEKKDDYVVRVGSLMKRHATAVMERLYF